MLQCKGEKLHREVKTCMEGERGGAGCLPPSLPLWRSRTGPLTSTESAIIPRIPASRNAHYLSIVRHCARLRRPQESLPT